MRAPRSVWNSLKVVVVVALAVLGLILTYDVFLASPSRDPSPVLRLSEASSRTSKQLLLEEDSLTSFSYRTGDSVRGNVVKSGAFKRTEQDEKDYAELLRGGAQRRSGHRGKQRGKSSAKGDANGAGIAPGWGVVSTVDWETPVTKDGRLLVTFEEIEAEADNGGMSVDQTQTSDHWPVFSKKYFPGPIPKSPYKSRFNIKWGFNTTAFMQQPEVKGQPPKLITWMVPPRNVPILPEPVRLRICPEMPCRLTTNATFGEKSSALLWNGQIMRDAPPVRSQPNQVFVFHNNEPQKPDWTQLPSFRSPAWKSDFNWTFTYRNDSDITAFYGYVVKRPTPVQKNYTAIMAKKTKLAAWMTSHCETHGKRERYVHLLQQHVPVDVFGRCGPNKCSRSSDDSCFRMFSEEYKFLFAFENAFCTDYMSEKFFRYLEGDMIVVARGSDEYRDHAPPGTYINTNDFQSTKELADYLLHLDTHPEDYVRLLKRKNRYQTLFEDWPLRNARGDVVFMQYHFEAIGYCEICRRLWDIERYRKHVPDITEWFDRENCYLPDDLR